jgi:hypothetical protein
MHMYYRYLGAAQCQHIDGETDYVDFVPVRFRSSPRHRQKVMKTAREW